MKGFKNFKFEKLNMKLMIAIGIAIIIVLVAIMIIFRTDLIVNHTKTKSDSNSSFNSTSNDEFNSSSEFSSESDNTSNDESNSNLDSNTSSNEKIEYLDLSKTPSYEQDIFYISGNTFYVGMIDKYYVPANIEIQDEKAYIFYGDSKTEIKNVSNVKQVQAANISTDCGESEMIQIYLLTTEGKIYYYREQLYNISYPNCEKYYPTTNKEINAFINEISSGFKEWSLTKKYTDISIAEVPCGPGCGCGSNLVGTASDGEKYVINLSEISMDKYYDYSYYTVDTGIWVSLDGKIHTNFWHRDEKEELNIQVLYLFNGDGIYVLSTDLYLYKCNSDNIEKVKSKKVSKIGIKEKTDSEYTIIVYFNDGSVMIISRASIISF